MDEMRKLTPGEFPPQLLEIPDVPEHLYLCGTLPSPETTLLSVVGSRKHSPYGKDVCEELIAGLSGYDIAIVSGLALGIDSIAHQAALRAGLKTIAVPGSGLGKEVLYPATNFHLAEKIVREGGALLSEFEPDFKATVWSFPQRNRIMAGLSRAVLIIEAAERSGTLITARMALDYNRDVYVVPASIFSESGKGSNTLIRQGAMPVLSSADLLRELGFDIAQTETGTPPADCSDEEKNVLALLKDSLGRDELIRALAIETSKANMLLSVMEIKGLIKEQWGVVHRR